MQNGIQSVYLSIGNEACFFLQLLNIAEKDTEFRIDPITAALICKAKNLIYFNINDLKDKNNFLIKGHAEILNLITGKTWQYKKETPSYRPKKNEYVIKEYQNGDFIHFDSDNFHSLQNSLTVKNGRVISQRIFSVKE